jgi:hypothetical protein
MTRVWTRRVPSISIALVGFVAVIIGAIRSRSHPAQQDTVGEREPEQRSHAAAASTPPRATRIVSPISVIPDTSEAATEKRRYGMAEGALGDMLQRIKLSPPNGGPPLVVAQTALPYIQGVWDGLLAADPEMTSALQRRFADIACGDTTLSDAEWIALGFVGKFHPAIVSSSALDCALSNRTAEGPALWSLMDAWRHTDLPKPDSLLALERTATDPQTLRRFVRFSDEVKVRELGRVATSEADLESPALATTAAGAPSRGTPRPLPR